LGKNIAPNWHATASNSPSPNGSDKASAGFQTIRPSDDCRAFAWSSMDGLRSVAAMRASAGRRAARTRVKTPVPAAVSNTDRGRVAATRSAKSSA